MNSEKPKTILVLGYCADQTRIHQILRSSGCEVQCGSADPKFQRKYDLVISFGYRKILTKAQIELLACPIVNLHMSYLPFNRGAHPVFWSFFEQTPLGVSIHLIDEGIDTGPVLWQIKTEVDIYTTTFEAAYWYMFGCLEELFERKLDNILSFNWTPLPSQLPGTYHTVKDLPREFQGWDQNIDLEITRLKKLKVK